MKRIFVLTTAALMGASVISSPVLAQAGVDAGADIGIGGSAEAGNGSASGDAGIELNGNANAEVDPGTTAAVGTSLKGALGAISNNGASAATIRSMSTVESVEVVRVNELPDADAQALADAETENSASINDLRASLESNSEVMAALQANSVEPSSVVAADATADGTLTVYTK